MIDKLYKIFWSTWFRKTQKYLAHATAFAFIAMALGLLLQDMLRGYETVACVYLAHGITEWAKEEFQFV